MSETTPAVEEKTDTATSNAGTSSNETTAGTTQTEPVPGLGTEAQPNPDTTKATEEEKPASDEAVLTAKPEAKAPEKDGAGKPAEASPDAELELRLPKGVEANDVLLEEFKPIAKELGLKSEGAQKLLDLHAKSLDALVERATKQEAEKEAERSKGWMAASRKDKEIGGAAFDANAAVARKAIDKFATPELRQVLVEAGLGNHPEMIRFCLRVGRALAEDSVAGSTASNAAPGNQAEEIHRQLYPTMFENK